MTGPAGGPPPQPGLDGGPIRLDHNATTPVQPHIAQAMRPYPTDFFGNPSGGHPATPNTSPR